MQAAAWMEPGPGSSAVPLSLKKGGYLGTNDQEEN